MNEKWKNLLNEWYHFSMGPMGIFVFLGIMLFIGWLGMLLFKIVQWLLD